VYPIDASATMFEHMSDLNAELSKNNALVKSHFHPINKKYPEALNDVIMDHNTIILVPSIATTFSDIEEEECYERLKDAGGIILGLLHHYERRETASLQNNLIKRIQSKGYGEPKVILQWDTWEFGFAPDTLIYMENLNYSGAN